MDTFEFDRDWSEVLRTSMQDNPNVEIFEPLMDSELLKAWAKSNEANPDCEFIK